MCILGHVETARCALPARFDYNGPGRAAIIEIAGALLEIVKPIGSNISGFSVSRRSGAIWKPISIEIVVEWFRTRSGHEILADVDWLTQWLLIRVGFDQDRAERVIEGLQVPREPD